ncbi:MAG TPA: hypothetical protein VL728_13460 [Cyclobacteriaceae bacterium]|nr:hypothetical protein [Cyclobacteriaceae bacterium]
MKTQRHFHFPAIHIHVNPLLRDIAVVVMTGLLVATAALTMLVMFVSQF